MSTVRDAIPRAGQEVYLSPDTAGTHGHPEGWFMVIDAEQGMVEGHCYVRGVYSADIDGAARVQVFYLRTSGLLIRDPS